MVDPDDRDQSYEFGPDAMFSNVACLIYLIQLFRSKTDAIRVTALLPQEQQHEFLLRAKMEPQGWT